MIGIYKITETETGKCYIGQSRRMESRLKDHNKRFHPDTHTYEVLLECNADVLDFFEKAFISGYDCLEPKGLNKTIGGAGLLNVSRKGQQLSAEHKAKLSAIRKGKPSSNKGKPSILKGRQAPNKGVAHSTEAILKMSEARKAYWTQRKLENT